MTRVIVILFIAFLVTSCGSSEAQKEVVKSAKIKSSTDRINASEQNSKALLKDLDD